MLWIEIAMAVLAGAATAFQPGVNAKFAEFAGHRIHGGVINFAVGFAVMLVVWFIASRVLGGAGAGIPEPARLAAGPWWMWMGGLLGAFFVTTAVFLAPKIGAANYLAALIVGQLVASVIIDQFGWMGFTQIPISIGRVVGVLLIIGGLVCIKWW